MGVEIDRNFGVYTAVVRIDNETCKRLCARVDAQILAHKKPLL